MPRPRIMRTLRILIALAAVGVMALGAGAQQRPYIGFVYPAGGKQGDTLRVKIGGQNLEDVQEVLVSGEGVAGKLVEAHRPLSNQDFTLLSEQLKLLKGNRKSGANEMMSSTGTMASDQMMTSTDEFGGSTLKSRSTIPESQLAARLESRMAEYVNRPASAAIAHIVYVELSIAPDARPGQRELRLQTGRGISNPMFIHVGQLREYSREPMRTTPLQVLGKEHLSLRKRPQKEAEQTVELPCTMNGQIAAGEVNRYRFKAVKGQNLVFSAMARQLIPFIADAVPGWFQPVLRLTDAAGKELAYNDDYQFRPDPVILFKPELDGEYLLEIYDSIYRGREDFVYRITGGEVPFITGMFPLGGPLEGPARVKVEGWNLGSGNIPVIEQDQPGLCRVLGVANGIVSSPRPYELDSLPTVDEMEDDEPVRNMLDRAIAITLPVIINGRINRKDDWDVFKFVAGSNEVFVAEVRARRLESPLDSVLKVTDAKGNLLAFNDDNDDPFSGANTHPADSYIRTVLPSNGVYCVHIGDTSRNGGREFAYRLRLGPPQPDFALRVVPSSLGLRGKSGGTVNVHIDRKDGFTNAVKIALATPSEGFNAPPVFLTGTQTVARLTIKSLLSSTPRPVDISITGAGTIGGTDAMRVAVPAEDRMQAFLWKHLVPASAFKLMVFDPGRQPAPARTAPVLSEAKLAEMAASVSKAKQGSFTKQQVSGRLRQLRRLYEEGLLTDSFYLSKVAECEAAKQN